MRILIAEDDAVSSRILAAMLIKWGHEVIVTHNGLEAWQKLQEDDPASIAILDWVMPEMDGLEVCRRVRARTSDSPTYLILLTARNRQKDVVEGLEAGADDFLTKPFDRHELRVRLKTGARVVELQRSLAERVRELEEAVARRRKAEEELRNLTLTDDLTGLYNRRGFFTLAEYRLKTLRRMRERSLIFYADMDGLKRINDTFGHHEGSQALIRVGEILRRTFRESDIVARLGGDEFAILVADASRDGIDGISARLMENLEQYNRQGHHDYELNVSLGAVSIDSATEATVEQLIARADAAMYQNKRYKRESRLLLSA
jgi:diguanylate cyclase (GGDEF)-like protein